MKILQISHGLPPKENAGVELYTLYLSRALAQLGHEVSIFCRERDPQKKEFSIFEDQIDGLRITRVVNNLTNFSSARQYYDNHFFDQAFYEILKRRKPDLVHFQHTFGLSANLIRIAREEGYPVILMLHDFFLLCHRFHLLREGEVLCSGPLYGLECAPCMGVSLHPHDIRTRFFLKMKGKLPFSVIKWTKRFFIPTRYLGDKGYEAFHRYRYIYEILKNPDLILVPSQFVREIFLKYYRFIESKLRVLPLGIPPIKYGSLSRGRARDADRPIRFCYFGNILPLKGLHVLVEAFKGLPPDRAILTIYGGRVPWNEGYYNRLKEQALGHRVEFKGSFQRENLPEILRDEDVFILPSICYESFSFAIREAHSLGLPVIASRIGAIPEAIEDGSNGLLFIPGNSEDLQKSMLRFIDDPELVESMSSKTKQAKSMEEQGAEMVEIYRGMVGRNR